MNNLLLDAKTNLNLKFNLQPQGDENWIKTDEHTYQSKEYILTINDTQNPEREYRTIEFALAHKDNIEFAVINYEIFCYIPCVDVYNVPPRFMGYAHVSHHNPAEILSTATSKDFPYVTYGSRSGENRFSIGLLNQITETKILRSGKGGYMYYDTNIIKFTRPVNGVNLHRKELRDGIFLSSARKSWFDVSSDYWHYIDMRNNYQPNPTPPSAFGPTWCSWFYCTDINEEKIWQNAVAAKELGFKTLMIDAGWFCSDTDVPFPDSILTSETIGFGRVDADKSKFPDMKKLVDKIHALGLYVWAWATPRWIFRAVEEGEGAVDKRLLDLRIRTENGETTPLLCTRNKDTWEHAAKFTSYLLKKYGFDGLKFDCWELDEGMAVCTANHSHELDTMGEGTIEWTKQVYKAMTEVNPEAVVWFNNTTAKQYSNYSVSPNEVYCQPDENWRMSVALKSFTNGIYPRRGIVSQLCEGSFHIDESVQNISRQLAILMMGHTPEFQVDLTILKPEQKKLIKKWFEFYEKHKTDLHFGKYTPFGFEHSLGGPMSATPPHVKIESESKTFLYIGTLRIDPIELSGKIKELFIFNLQNIDGIDLPLNYAGQDEYEITIYDYFHEEIEKRSVEKAETIQNIKLNVKSGAYAKISFVN